MALRIERSEEDGRKLIGIFARIANDKGQVLSISAREGRFLANRRGPQHDRLPPYRRDHRAGHAGRGTARAQLHPARPADRPAGDRALRARGGEAREYLLPELARMGWNSDVPDEERAVSQATFNYRMVEVVMMLMLPLLAVALAIPPKRSTSALGVFISIVLVVAYHKVNQYGQDVASLGRIDPLLALWGPFSLFAALIGWMYYRVAFVPGGQAIGALETAYAKLAKRITALLKRRDRSRQLREFASAEEEAAAGACLISSPRAR